MSSDPGSIDRSPAPPSLPPWMDGWNHLRKLADIIAYGTPGAQNETRY